MGFQVLDSPESRHLTVVCMECWRQISDFHNFQQSVLMAQTKHGLLLAGQATRRSDRVSNSSKSVFVISEVTNEIPWNSATSNMKRRTKLLDATTKCKQEDIDFDNQKFMIFPPNLGEEPTEILTNSASSTTSYSRKQNNNFSITTPNEVTPGPSNQPYLNPPDISCIKEELSVENTNYGGDAAFPIKEEEQLFEMSQEYDDASANESYDDTDDSNSDNELLALQDERPQLRTMEDYDEFIAKWRPILECVFCCETAGTFSLLLQHYQNQHPQETCHIMCCEQKFHNRHEIVQHIFYHNDRRAFKCEQCFKSFTRKYRLNQHMQRMHFGKPPKCVPIDCPKCGKILQHKSHLNRHLELHCNDDENVMDKPYACDVCGKSFGTLKALGTHNLSMHSEISERHKCNICDKGFIYRRYLEDHMAKHTEIRSTCPYCPKTYKYRTALFDHYKKCHPKEWEERKRDGPKRSKSKKDTNCFLCPKQFKYPYQLKDHIKKWHTKTTDA